jgi:hypothetical protein
MVRQEQREKNITSVNFLANLLLAKDVRAKK